MNDNPQRIREPELKEVLMSLESLSNRYDGLTFDLRNKIQSIHNPPQLEPMNKSLDVNAKDKPSDCIGLMNEQIDRLKTYANRVEDLLGKLNQII